MDIAHVTNPNRHPPSSIQYIEFGVGLRQRRSFGGCVHSQ